MEKMEKKEIQAIVVKLIGEINQLENKNKSQEKFLDALSGTKQDSTLLNRMVQNDSLLTNTTLSKNTVSNIRIESNEWKEIGIRLGDDWDDQKKSK